MLFMVVPLCASWALGAFYMLPYSLVWCGKQQQSSVRRTLNVRWVEYLRFHLLASMLVNRYKLLLLACLTLPCLALPTIYQASLPSLLRIKFFYMCICKLNKCVAETFTDNRVPSIPKYFQLLAVWKYFVVSNTLLRRR